MKFLGWVRFYLKINGVHSLVKVKVKCKTKIYFKDFRQTSYLYFHL